MALIVNSVFKDGHINYVQQSLNGPVLILILRFLILDAAQAEIISVIIFFMLMNTTEIMLIIMSI